jgi:hypothetical protein
MRRREGKPEKWRRKAKGSRKISEKRKRNGGEGRKEMDIVKAREERKQEGEEKAEWKRRITKIKKYIIYFSLREVTFTGNPLP